MKRLLLLILVTAIQNTFAQDSLNNSGWFSLGGRSSMSTFDSDGFGMGTGGQFRIQLSNSVNTDWFADYISINVQNKVRSEYFHIGWSVLLYPFKRLQSQKIIQPYILAGHCFDYNKKTILSNNIYFDRWGSAVQAGIGTHFNLTKRFDVSLTCQYMIHLTGEIETEINGNNVHLIKHNDVDFEGHLLTTLSLNYKIGRLWKR